MNAEYECKAGEAMKLETLIIRLPTWNILHLFMLLMQLPVSHDWNVADWNVAGNCEGWECHDPNQSVHTPTTNHLMQRQ